MLDIDASLVDVHTESKEQAAPNFKGGSRLSSDVLLRRRHGRGTELDAAARQRNGQHLCDDHVTLLDEAIAQLPCRDREVGHRWADDWRDPGRPLDPRARGLCGLHGGVSPRACRARKVASACRLRTNAQLVSAIHETSVVQRTLWHIRR